MEQTQTTPKEQAWVPNTDPSKKHVFLLLGESATGKTTSLKHLRNPEGVLYLNCEVGKNLPFKSSFKSVIIEDPMQIPDIFNQLKTRTDIHTVIIDSLSYLMKMYKRVYIDNSSDSRKEWGNYASYFETLMAVHVKDCTQNVIVLSHTLIKNEDDSSQQTRILADIQGALGKNGGIEGAFENILASKAFELDEILLPHVDPTKARSLRGFNNDMLTINEQEDLLGFKHVFQTKRLAISSREKVRTPEMVFTLDEAFIDNNMQNVIDRYNSFYNN